MSKRLGVGSLKNRKLRGKPVPLNGIGTGEGTTTKSGYVTASVKKAVDLANNVVGGENRVELGGLVPDDITVNRTDVPGDGRELGHGFEALIDSQNGAGLLELTDITNTLAGDKVHLCKLLLTVFEVNGIGQYVSNGNRSKPNKLEELLLGLDKAIGNKKVGAFEFLVKRNNLEDDVGVRINDSRGRTGNLVNIPLRLNIRVVLILGRFGRGIKPGGRELVPFVNTHTGLGERRIRNLTKSLDLIPGNVIERESLAHARQDIADKLEHQGGLAIGNLAQDLNVHKVAAGDATLYLKTEIVGNILLADVGFRNNGLAVKGGEIAEFSETNTFGGKLHRITPTGPECPPSWDGCGAPAFGDPGGEGQGPPL